MLAVFRADASATLGGGHVMRCLTLADTLAGSGWRCGFACNGEAVDVVPGVRRHDLLPLPPNADSVGLMKKRWGNTWDLAVIDHYGLDAAFESALRPIASRILVIDDLHDRKHDCDFLLDQTHGRTIDAYEGLIPRSARSLLGPDYALLRPEFAAMRGEALDKRRQIAGGINILVSFGATDPHNLGGLALEALEPLGPDISVDVVLGGMARYSAAVGKAAVAAPFPVRVHENTLEMPKLMRDADIALGSPGTTSWERCCLGLPSILVTFAENQREIAAGLGRAGAAVDLGWYEDVSKRDLSEAVRALY
ncbi:MAG TPA: UDP-2,4-diacetamido-2,4,6-trideoxy-beta-L-altropyranose hydrolase, partial [Rhodospirillales bacterium]|nr:UDP-2,4-diacetamido-2,4,6-trideoxy-beta-L-altropyranose hydrolase [Rhodospirillales bacterium]